MNDTAERRKQVDFVDYLKIGQSITVPKGNPKHVTSLASLSGLRVSVESGTTNRDFLIASSKKLVKQGKKAITIVTFPKDTDSFAALLAGRVDAYYADSPPAAYYAKQHSTKVQIAGNAGQPVPGRDRYPQGRPAAGCDAEGDRRHVRDGRDEADRRQVGDDESVVLLRK